jgi:hypothetical protein
VTPPTDISAIPAYARRIWCFLEFLLTQRHAIRMLLTWHPAAYAFNTSFYYFHRHKPGKSGVKMVTSDRKKPKFVTTDRKISDLGSMPHSYTQLRGSRFCWDALIT